MLFYLKKTKIKPSVMPVCILSSLLWVLLAFLPFGAVSASYIHTYKMEINLSRYSESSQPWVHFLLIVITFRLTLSIMTLEALLMLVSMQEHIKEHQYNKYHDPASTKFKQF